MNRIPTPLCLLFLTGLSTCLSACIDDLKTGTPDGGTVCTANLQTDPANCGACQRVCPSGVCTAGVCQPVTMTCPTGLTLCNGFCKDTAVDGTNCGGCGVRCTATQACSGSACMDVVGCPPPRAMCAGTCTDTTTDSANCGGCGTACPSGTSCAAARCACPLGQTLCGSACTSTMVDARNCGACGTVCSAGTTCTAGVCGMVPLTNSVGNPCVRDADCGAGGTCIPTIDGYPAGYCVYACAAGVMPGTPCGPGSGICLGSGAQLACYQSCVPTNPVTCRAGYVCNNVTTDNSLGVCLPNCTLNPATVCGAYTCNTATGQCSGACTAAATCSTGSTCDTATTACQCGPATNCGAFSRCYPAVGAAPSYCGCDSTAFCSPGRTCNTATGICR